MDLILDNDIETEVFDICSECNHEIYEHEEYFEIDSDCFCEECGEDYIETNFKKVAVTEEGWGDYGD